MPKNVKYNVFDPWQVYILHISFNVCSPTVLLYVFIQVLDDLIM